MTAIVPILFGAVVTVILMLACGRLLLRALKLRLYRQEENVLAMAAGAGCLSLLVFLLTAAGLANLTAFLALGVLIIAAAGSRGAHRGVGNPLPAAGGVWRFLFWTLFAAFTYVYFFCALAPETSPDGSQYHLGLVNRYFATHGFREGAGSMYASLSQGLEMLFLYAFAFGRHSAAALVHFAFLVTLPFAMLCYARRFGFARAGAAAALLVYLCPIVGWDGSVAYNDVATAFVLFALFHAVQLWRQEDQTSLLVLIGLLAGFAYAVKYTAYAAMPYAAGMVAWKAWRDGKGTRELFRSVGIVAACAFLMAAPWAVKNWIMTGNPFAPFLNAWFPNPHYHVGLEQAYRAQFASWGEIKNVLEVPLELTVRGAKLQGVFGPVFLLAPLGLLALRRPEGRQLLLAGAVFSAAYPMNRGGRFLIPALPFLALAMALAVEKARGAAPALVMAHALTAWPASVGKYCDRYALRIEQTPVRAALRLIPEQEYLASRLYWYPAARMLEEQVPPESRTLVFTAPPQAYTTRTILVDYEAALNNNLSDMLLGAVRQDWLPSRRLTFRFSERPLRRLRLRQTAPKSAAYWSVSEFRLLLKGRELPREAQWRLRAQPNPFEVQMAFDNNPITRWRSWQGQSENDCLEVDFGRFEKMDSVVLEVTPDQPGARLRLEGQMAAGPWEVLAEGPTAETNAVPRDWRWMMSRELRWQGIEYLLLAKEDFIADDVLKHTAAWGLTLVDERRGMRLYRVN